MKFMVQLHLKISVQWKGKSVPLEGDLRRRLLEDDRQWAATLAEAAISRSPKRLRSLFAVMLKNM